MADAYLFTVLRWMARFAIDLNDWPSLARYMVQIGSRASVHAALAAEAVSPEVK